MQVPRLCHLFSAFCFLEYHLYEGKSFHLFLSPAVEQAFK